jgi:hypothetical protein
MKNNWSLSVDWYGSENLLGYRGPEVHVFNLPEPRSQYAKSPHVSDGKTGEENIWNKCPVLVTAKGKKT